MNFLLETIVEFSLKIQELKILTMSKGKNRAFRKRVIEVEKTTTRKLFIILLKSLEVITVSLPRLFSPITSLAQLECS